MTLARKLLLAGIVLIAPLLVSGLLEALDIKVTVAARTHCYWPEVELGVQRSADGFVLADDRDDEKNVAILMFDSLSKRYYDERVACATKYTARRRLRLVSYGQSSVPSSEAELEQIRDALQQYLSDQGADSRLIAEVGLPDVQFRGINWPGVYVNGMVLLVLMGIPISLLAIPAYHVSPYARGKRRQSRGHCPICDYDLRANVDDGCPECGWRRRGS